MVKCRCGCEFYNSHWDNFVICPQCERVYANEAENMAYPATQAELRWTCNFCGFLNEDAEGSCRRRACAKCGQPRYPAPPTAAPKAKDRKSFFSWCKQLFGK